MFEPCPQISIKRCENLQLRKRDVLTSKSSLENYCFFLQDIGVELLFHLPFCQPKAEGVDECNYTRSVFLFLSHM